MTEATLFVDLVTGAIRSKAARSVAPAIRVRFNTFLKCVIGFVRDEVAEALADGTGVTLVVKPALGHTAAAVALDVTEAVTGSGTARRYEMQALVTGDTLSGLLNGLDEAVFSLQVAWGSEGAAGYGISEPLEIVVVNAYVRPGDELPDPTGDAAWVLLKDTFPQGTPDEVERTLEFDVGGVTDHGALTGLADDDHPQYLNNARGDARYAPVGAATGTNTGDVSLAGVPNYLTISGQVVTRGLINLASHVTGVLPLVNGGAGLQPETVAFLNAVTGLDASYAESLDQLIVSAKRDGWWALADELYVFAGSTLAQQLIKLKTPGAASLTATNMTDADVDPVFGFGPSVNTNKFALSDYVPSVYGRSSSNFCFAASTSGIIAGSATSCILSSVGGAGLFKIVLGPAQGGLYNQTSTESLPAWTQNGGLQTYSFDANVCTRYLDDAFMSSRSVSATTLDQAMTFWRASFNSVFDHATGRLSFVYLGQRLSAAQARAMGQAVRRFEFAIGRRRILPTNVFVGDSITYGTGATTMQTTRFSTIVNRALAGEEVNLGVQGATSAQVLTRWADATRPNPSRIFIMHGTNDAASAYPGSYRTNLDTFLTGWIAAGVSPNNIFVCSLPWSPDGARTFANQKLYADAARAAAVAAGCVFVDVFGRTLSNAAADIGVDNIHPSNTGHANIARVILEAVQQTAPRGLIGMGRGINVGAAINSDQAIHMIGSRWRIDKIVVLNASADLSASGCVASIRTASGGGGDALVSSFSFAGLTAATKLNTQTLAAVAGTDVISANPLFFRIAGTAHGSRQTVDVLVFGECLYP